MTHHESPSTHEEAPENAVWILYQLYVAWELLCTYLQCVACTRMQQPRIGSSVILSTGVAAREREHQHSAASRVTQP